MDLSVWFIAAFIAIIGGGFWGFISAGKSIRTKGAITAGRAIGQVALLVLTSVLAFFGWMYSIGILALGLLSDNSNTLTQLAPYVVGLAVFGFAMFALASRSLLFLARTVHHSVTSANNAPGS